MSLGISVSLLCWKTLKKQKSRSRYGRQFVVFTRRWMHSFRMRYASCRLAARTR